MSRIAESFSSLLTIYIDGGVAAWQVSFNISWLGDWTEWRHLVSEHRHEVDHGSQVQVLASLILGEYEPRHFDSCEYFIRVKENKLELCVRET